MTISSYCQKIYPKKILINGDTLILILPIQVKTLNKVFSYKEYLVEENKILNKTLLGYKLLSNKKDSLINDKIMLEKGYIQSINDSKKINDKLLIKGKRVKKQRNILFYSTIFLASMVLILK